MGDLDESSLSAEATLDALADAVLVCGGRGRLQYVNEAAATRLGVSRQQLRGRPAEDIVPERLRTVEGTPFFRWLARRYEQSQRPIRAPLLRPDGVEIHQAFRFSTLSFGSNEEAMVAVLTSPNESSDLESDPFEIDVRRASPERRYKAVFDSVPVGILHFDARGRITDCNDIFVRQMGSSRDRVVGVDMLTLPDEQVRAAVAEALAGRDGRFEGEYHSVTGRRRRLLRALFSPIQRDGKVQGGVGVIDDFTERQQIEVRLARTERMASLGRLAAGVAHEINNPLAYVRTSLDICRRQIERYAQDPDRAHLERALQVLEHADEGVGRVRVIVGDLKTFSRGDEGSWLPVDLASVAESAINLAHNEVRHRARLAREIEPVPPVMGSETRFVQVMVNLLVNAAQAIPEGEAERNQITLRIAPVDGDRVFIEVEDTGCGMDEETKERVFEPFWTSRPKGGGTGLGLSICHGIVTAAGGDIRVARTEPGRGTTFRVELPASGGSARLSPEPSPPLSPALSHALSPGPEQRAAPVQGAAPSTPRPRLLVVDDEAHLATTLRLGLGERFDVEVASSGRRALELLEAGGRYDLILCDLMMPDVSGMDFYERLTREYPELADRVVLMTGGAFTDRARDFLKAHRVRRLEKPFGLWEVERLFDAGAEPA